jgi:hypothetical protein
MQAGKETGKETGKEVGMDAGEERDEEAAGLFVPHPCGPGYEPSSP